VTGAPTALAPHIDAAWEERILPTLCEYARIPCLSPAFDPEWEARGALAEAAELLGVSERTFRRWTRRRCAVARTHA